MREIKFRAWNKSANRYSKPFTLKCSVLNFTDDDGLGIMKSLTDEVVEQFTGLTDKNDIEIYEGDIVAVWKTDADGVLSRVYLNHNELNHEVKWTHGYHIRIFGVDYDIELMHTAELEFHYVYEVIGNIHENPELLCAKK